MRDLRKCPECGKEMIEEPKFPGLFICPDGKLPINNSPPHQYKCSGMEVSSRGSKNFKAAIDKAKGNL